jgi:hypothetical protein
MNCDPPKLQTVLSFEMHWMSSTEQLIVTCDVPWIMYRPQGTDIMQLMVCPAQQYGCFVTREYGKYIDAGPVSFFSVPPY